MLYCFSCDESFSACSVYFRDLYLSYVFSDKERIFNIFLLTSWNPWLRVGNSGSLGWDVQYSVLCVNPMRDTFLPTLTWLWWFWSKCKTLCHRKSFKSTAMFCFVMLGALHFQLPKTFLGFSLFSIYNLPKKYQTLFSCSQVTLQYKEYSRWRSAAFALSPRVHAPTRMYNKMTYACGVENAFIASLSVSARSYCPERSPYSRSASVKLIRLKFSPKRPQKFSREQSQQLTQRQFGWVFVFREQIEEKSFASLRRWRPRVDSVRVLTF